MGNRNSKERRELAITPQETQGGILALLNQSGLAITKATLKKMSEDTLGLTEYQASAVGRFFELTQYYLELEMKRREEAEGLENPITKMEELLVAEMGGIQKERGFLKETLKVLEKERGEFRKRMLAVLHIARSETFGVREIDHSGIVEKLCSYEKGPLYSYTQLPGNGLETCGLIMRALGLGVVVDDIKSMNLGYKESRETTNFPVEAVKGVYGRVSELHGSLFEPWMRFGVAFDRDAFYRVIVTEPLFKP